MTPEQDAITDLAGRTAEAFLFYRELDFDTAEECFEAITEGYEDDWVNASRTIYKAFGSEDENSSVHAARMKRICETTLEWISRNIIDIVKVADKLSMKPVMNGAEVLEVLETREVPERAF